ncbi:hypothetical protein SDC9_196909 [bioreactor metagenome]|uniref:Uncharacterized protein n=1 Tax=bioreactor metagenome TaxID=1076179 RepID=A0A645IEN0_9ZZZZ
MLDKIKDKFSLIIACAFLIFICCSALWAPIFYMYKAMQMDKKIPAAHILLILAPIIATATMLKEFPYPYSVVILIIIFIATKAFWMSIINNYFEEQESKLS